MKPEELKERDDKLAEKSQNSVNISVAHIQENTRLKELLREASGMLKDIGPFERRLAEAIDKQLSVNQVN